MLTVGCRSYRRVGARLSRAQDVVDCVAVPGYSPAGGRPGCIFIHRCRRRELTILPPTGRVSAFPLRLVRDFTSRLRGDVLPCRRSGTGRASPSWAAGSGVSAEMFRASASAADASRAIAQRVSAETPSPAARRAPAVICAPRPGLLVRQVVPRPAAAHAPWLPGHDVRTRPRVVITGPDQNPAALAGAGQGESSGERAAAQQDGQMARLITDDLSAALIPDDHRAGTAFLPGPDPLIVPGGQRAVPGRHGRPPGTGIRRRPAGSRPRAQDPAGLDPETEIRVVASRSCTAKRDIVTARLHSRALPRASPALPPCSGASHAAKPRSGEPMYPAAHDWFSHSRAARFLPQARRWHPHLCRR